MRARHNLPAPTLGVSTLAARNQPEGMMTEQINMRSDPVRKLSRRPSMQYAGIVDTSEWKAYHTYTRGGVRYELGVTTADEVRVLRDGVLTVTETQTASIADYLSGTTTDDIRIHTIGDTSFILNTTQTVTVEATIDNTPEYAYINVTSALNYGEEVRLHFRWDDTSDIGDATSTVGAINREMEVVILIPNADGGNYTEADKQRATRAVAQRIEQAINATVLNAVVGGIVIPATAAIWCNATVMGSVVSIDASNLSGLTISVDGGQGDASIVPITEVKQDTAGLPKYAVAGTIVAIQPGLDANKTEGTYYLKANPISTLSPQAGDVMQEVFWNESADERNHSRIRGNTMPIVVTQDTVPQVRNTNALWEEREAGDRESNPHPVFINNTINALYTFQGRLVIATGDSVLMSNTDNLYLFYRESVLQLLATDTVSLGASSTDTDDVTGFGINNNDLIVNFPKKQFKVSGSSPITPQTTAMTPTTAYETAAKPEPLPLAGSLLLPFSYGDSGGIWDYTQKEQNDQNTAVAVTSMIEGYLQGDIELWAASASLDMAVVKCTASNVLYVYEQNTRQSRRTQMAWSTWELRLDDEILWIGFDENELQVVTLSGTTTERRTIDLSTTLPDAPDNIMLDDMVEVTVAAGTTTGTLPSTYPDHDDLVYVQTSNCKSPYYTAAASRTGDTITVTTDIHATGDATLYVGRPYSSEFTPTRQFIREEGHVVDIDRLSIKQLLLDVVHTNELSMDTVSEYYDTDTVTVLAERVGTARLGVKAFYSGDFQFSVRKQAKWATQRFYTNGYLPVNVIGMTWQGLYKQRTERL